MLGPPVFGLRSVGDHTLNSVSRVRLVKLFLLTSLVSFRNVVLNSSISVKDDTFIMSHWHVFDSENILLSNYRNDHVIGPFLKMSFGLT